MKLSSLSRNCLLVAALCVSAPPAALAAKKKEQVVEMSGISIIGNRELPKTLIIVPWKNSEVGVETELTNTLHEGLQPLDRDVFQRELDYYEISKP
jgi:hypothetical protein